VGGDIFFCNKHSQQLLATFLRESWFFHYCPKGLPGLNPMGGCIPNGGGAMPKGGYYCMPKGGYYCMPKGGYYPKPTAGGGPIMRVVGRISWVGMNMF